MPIQVDIFALIITILFLMIAVFLIPMMIQVKRTAQQVDVVLGEVQRDLLPMLRELRQASEKINKASEHAEQGLAQAGHFLESVGEVGDSIHGVTRFLQHDLGRYAGNAAGLWLGIRSASKVIMKQMKKQQGGQ